MTDHDSATDEDISPHTVESRARGISLSLTKFIRALASDRDRIAKELAIMTRDRDACIALFRPSERAAQIATDRNIDLSRDLSAAIARAEKAENERGEATREWKRAADHLRGFAEMHSMDATAETWAILHCAEREA